MKKLFPKFQVNAKPVALIISRIYTLGDWKPFRTLSTSGPTARRPPTSTGCRMRRKSSPSALAI